MRVASAMAHSHSQSRQGCFVAISRCIWGNPHRTQGRRLATTETIEFENLVDAESRAEAALAKKQVVTESEREIVREGNLNRLVDEQRRLDAEKEAELRRQEEALRMEEEAYYAAKREASKKAATQLDRKTPPPLPSGTSPTPPIANGDLLPTGKSGTGSHNTPTLPVTDSREEDDFDQFLESVKARQLSLATKAPSPPTTTPPNLVSDDEEEVDFGYWEKAALPPPTTTKPSHEADLDLL